MKKMFCIFVLAMVVFMYNNASAAESFRDCKSMTMSKSGTLTIEGIPFYCTGGSKCHQTGSQLNYSFNRGLVMQLQENKAYCQLTMQQYEKIEKIISRW